MEGFLLFVRVTEIALHRSAMVHFSRLQQTQRFEIPLFQNTEGYLGASFLVREGCIRSQLDRQAARQTANYPQQPKQPQHKKLLGHLC